LFANPYYAAALIGALIFWLWPAFLFKNLGAYKISASLYKPAA